MSNNLNPCSGHLMIHESVSLPSCSILPGKIYPRCKIRYINISQNITYFCFNVGSQSLNPSTVGTKALRNILELINIRGITLSNNILVCNLFVFILYVASRKSEISLKLLLLRSKRRSISIPKKNWG